MTGKEKHFRPCIASRHEQDQSHNFGQKTSAHGNHRAVVDHT